LTGVFNTWTTSGPKKRHSISMGLRLMYTPLSVVRKDWAVSIRVHRMLTRSSRQCLAFIVFVVKVGGQRYKTRLIFPPLLAVLSP